MPQVAFVSAANSLSLGLEDEALDHQASLVNLSGRPRVRDDEDERETEKKAFLSRLNPHELRRRDQLLAGQLWYATFDQDLDDASFKQVFGGSKLFEESAE